MDQEEREKIANMQAAYDTSYEIYNFSRQAVQKSKLTSLFGIAAAVGSTFVIANPVVPILIITAAFMYDTYKKRETMLTLSHAFNEVSKTMSNDAKYHMKDIENSLKGIRELGLDDINPMKHWEKKNYMGLGFVALPLFLGMPELIPAMIASLAGYEDTQRSIKITAAAYKTGEDLARLYPDLQPPGQSQNNEPPPPQA